MLRRTRQRHRTMFIHRFIEFIRARNWGIVLLEIMILVVGIFVGIQASNWNDDRLERAQERDYLARLLEDFQASHKGIERDNNVLQDQLENQREFAEILESCQMSEEQLPLVYRVINTIGLINAPRFVRRTIDELSASGRMDILQNKKLKKDLADIVAELEWRDSVTETTFRLTEHHRVVIDQKIMFDINRPFGEIPWQLEVEFDLSALCGDPTARSSIAASHFYSKERLVAYREIERLYAEFIPKLERELEQRWSAE